MIIKMKPVLVQKEVWGGHKIKDNFGYIDAPDRCGEAWGISAHKTFSSVIANTSFKGMTLRELFNNNKELFGNYEGEEFPILVKIIDARDNLSIQVHPNDDYAKQFKSLGKEECWYVLDTNEYTEIIIGHKAKTKEELHKAIDQDRIEDLVNAFPIKKGDFFYINAGTLHAICKGTTLLEVQQSSDITYRVYDYNRLQDDGTLREIHKGKAKDVITVPDNRVNKIHRDRYFTYDIIQNNTLTKEVSHKHGDYIFILEGEGLFDKVPVRIGDFLMVSSSTEYKIYGTLKYQKTTF
ncbi:Putative mannose-6-phosphate isomerase YvyI [Candidatus Izimaplasma bacterium HR1]|jgi:mannose-6-phosphate isomerase|uniref:type I phosphomannose isomerase catalytic subunit n=1 Tax=Candidatus Izimoplasma sp. HR1 TaxID=1541959 RepID=UPI0004F7D126|nr:Putative mannose-6-phosphate isomerase YvyI [Candidatus Izimaplasma bacterium HR1]